MLRDEFQADLALWDQGKIKPHIDASYPFSEAAAAHRRILQRQNIGTIMLTPEQPSALQATTAATSQRLPRLGTSP